MSANSLRMAAEQNLTYEDYCTQIYNYFVMMFWIGVFLVLLYLTVTVCLDLYWRSVYQPKPLCLKTLSAYTTLADDSQLDDNRILFESCMIRNKPIKRFELYRKPYNQSKPLGMEYLSTSMDSRYNECRKSYKSCNIRNTPTVEPTSMENLSASTDSRPDERRKSCNIRNTPTVEPTNLSCKSNSQPEPTYTISMESLSASQKAEIKECTRLYDSYIDNIRSSIGHISKLGKTVTGETVEDILTSTVKHVKFFDRIKEIDSLIDILCKRFSRISEVVRNPHLKAQCNPMICAAREMGQDVKYILYSTEKTLMTKEQAERIFPKHKNYTGPEDMDCSP